MPSIFNPLSLMNNTIDKKLKTSLLQIKSLSPSWLKMPCSFLETYKPLWLLSLLILVILDLASKKIITEHLNFNLSYDQYQSTVATVDRKDLVAFSNHPNANGVNQIDIWGAEGKYTKLRLVFNDRFVFGLGPNWPYLGFFLSFFAIVFLFFYRWYNPYLGHSLAWLLVFSGAFGNLIDKMFIKSLTTREWVFSLAPQSGYVSGVVDFIECIWFGWHNLSDTFLLSFLSMDTWPTFNVADSMISVGIVLLLITMNVPAERTETV